MMAPVSTLSPEDLLADYPGPMRDIGEWLRGVVRRAVPAAVERVRPGWRLIGYDLPSGRRSVYFAWVWPESVHVHLGFQHGIYMDDNERMLEGAHLRLKQVRFTTFKPGDEIPEKALISLTRQAARIAALPREARLALLLDQD